MFFHSLVLHCFQDARYLPFYLSYGYIADIDWFIIKINKNSYLSLVPARSPHDLTNHTINLSDDMSGIPANGHIRTFETWCMIEKICLYLHHR